MNRDAPATQVVDPQHAADDVSPHVVEHKDLPYRLSGLAQDGSRLRFQTIRSGVVPQGCLVR